ncbi:MAG: hypothetical protein U9O96_07705 [Candidatus Thermoplasmatota archaeon]|nr:hypothetical protein [Candidatus Thermoplasmatota archaeon]
MKSMPNEKFDIEEANLQLSNTIMKILTEEMPALKEKIKKMCLEVKRAKYLIYVFSVALFMMGIFFLIAALSLAFSNNWEKVVEGLGFGSASAASLVSLLLLRPINRVQEANSDASQAEMIYYCWELGILLYIRAMDITDRGSIKEAAEKIRDLTSKAIGLLEKYYEIEPE